MKNQKRIDELIVRMQSLLTEIDAINAEIDAIKREEIAGQGMEIVDLLHEKEK